MRKETIKKNKEKDKRKKEIEKLKKSMGVSKSLSVSEQNKMLLSSNKEEESEKVVEEKKSEKLPMRTEFKCSCGKMVIIESDDPKFHTISSCSSCR